ncbi:MAG: ParB/RepB/Spo0J family partition protein [Nitrospirae bacterium]|nr:ParB/RepB/Spo0J family partition protein [Nitrospirota bacterium]
MGKKEALGRGLGALIPQRKPDVPPPVNARLEQGTLEVDIDRIIPSSLQPRKRFDEDSLRELADSIRENGIIQPPVVRRTGDGTFELIAGERRWRASHLAGLKKIPVIVKDTAPAETLAMALIENIQREDLNPLETAEAFDHLMKDFGLTQEEMSKKVGKDRASVANYLRLLKLASEVKMWVTDGLISFGHAKAILASEDENAQVELAREVIKRGLSVRETEALAKKKKTGEVKKPESKAKNPQIASIEEKLIRRLGTKVMLDDRGKKGGRISIDYYSLDEFDRLLEILLS